MDKKPPQEPQVKQIKPPMQMPKSNEVEELKQTAARCENGVFLLDNGLFQGGAAERIRAHREWMHTMLAGIQKRIYKLQDAEGGK